MPVRITYVMTFKGVTNGAQFIPKAEPISTYGYFESEEEFKEFVRVLTISQVCVGLKSIKPLDGGIKEISEEEYQDRINKPF